MENREAILSELGDMDLIRLVCHWEPPNVDPPLPRRIMVSLSREVWELQDGVEDFELDWDGIAESTPEACKAMADHIRKTLLAEGIEKVALTDKTELDF